MLFDFSMGFDGGGGGENGGGILFSRSIYGNLSI